MMSMARSNPFVVRAEGMVLGLGIGCFGELSGGLITSFIIMTSNGNFHVHRYPTWIATTKVALGMLRLRIRRVLGHEVIVAWSDLALDRSRKLVGLLQSSAACDESSQVKIYSLNDTQAKYTEQSATNTGPGFNRGSWGGALG